MKAFIDVGGHEGQTLDEAIKPCWAFDKIYCLEPMPRQSQVLSSRYGNLEKVSILPYGLSDSTGSAMIYGDNNIMEASMYAEKRDVNACFETECSFVEASTFVWDLAEDVLIMKLNCEGAEGIILQNLIDTGAIWNLRNVMIDFDVRKIPGMEWKEQHILDQFKEIGFTRYSLCDDVMKGATHQDRIANWLKGIL